MIPIDLQFDYPWAWSRSVEVDREQLGGGGVWDIEDIPDEIEVYGGMRVDAAVKRLGDRDLYTMVTVGLRNRSESWERLPAFDSSLTELVLAYGVRTVRDREGDILRPFAGAGAGLQITIFDPSYWQTHVNPMPHLYSDVGATVGSGRLRLVFGARMAFGVRLDEYRGRAESAEGALLWTYHPGSSSISFSVGLQFR